MKNQCLLSISGGRYFLNRARFLSRVIAVCILGTRLKFRPSESQPRVCNYIMCALAKSLQNLGFIVSSEFKTHTWSTKRRLYIWNSKCLLCIVRPVFLKPHPRPAFASSHSMHARMERFTKTGGHEHVAKKIKMASCGFRRLPRPGAA